MQGGAIGQIPVISFKGFIKIQVAYCVIFQNYTDYEKLNYTYF